MQKGLSSLLIVMIVATLAFASVGWYVYNQFLVSTPTNELIENPTPVVPSIANTQIPDLKTDEDVNVESDALLRSDLEQLEAELDMDIDDLGI